MHEHEYREDPEELAKAQRQGYEHRDVDTSRLGRAGVMFFLFTILSIVVSLGAMKAIFWIQNRDSLAYQSSPEPRRKLPPGPLLQSNVSAKEDILKLREKERVRLSTTGIDAETGKKHIPIEQAIEILAARGLPVASTSTPEAKSPEPARAAVAPKPAAEPRPEVRTAPTEERPAAPAAAQGETGRMRPQPLSTPGLRSRIAPAMKGEEAR